MKASMNRKLLLLTTIYILFLSFNAYSSYFMTELEATALDVPDVINMVDWDNTDTGYPNDDDKQTVAIGFSFQFDDTLYTDVTILTNGILKFGAIERMHRDYRNEALPTDEGDRFISVYWDDLVDDGPASVTYGNSGTAPNRKFIVNWTNVRAYSNNLRYDFQVVLYENGDVRYRYNNNTSNGESATIGLEIDDSDFVQYSYNSISVEVSFDLLFRNQLLALPSPVAQYRLDELAWDGSFNEVVDSGISNLHGRSFLGADTSSADPAVGTNIGTCNYGVFDGVNDFVAVPDDNLLDFDNDFSVGVWIKIDSIPTSGLKTIVSKDENYEFHVNSSGQINWWWRSSILNVERELDSTSAILPGTWTHIVISFKPGDQRIFINGTESGTASFTGSAATNSDPLNFGSDQNSPGRYFNGDIDEVNIFDQALSSIQSQELMNITRPCSSFNLCVSSFPDGLNSHSGGDISFDRDAQLFFSPDDILTAGTVSLTGSSTQRSCVSVECQADGLAVDPTVSQAFPDTSGNTSDENVNNNNTGNIGSGENEYRNVTMGNNATLDVLAGFSDYYIDDFSAGSNATLNLIAGTYWFNDFSAGQGLNIIVTGGTARLYINNSFTLPSDSIINSPSSGAQGDASQLLLYGYNSINTERDSTFSGVIYGAANIEIDRSSNYYGAITGADISIGRDTNVFFNPTAAASLNYGDLCQSLSCILGSFNITQPSFALACPGIRSQVSIQAMCDDGVTLKDDYIGTVDLTSSENGLTEFYDSLNSVPVINSISYDGSESGLKNVYMFHKNESPVLVVIAEDPIIPVTSISTNSTDFRTQGFAITEPDSFSCGSSTSLILTAIGDDDSGVACQVLTGFTGTKGIKSWYAVNTDSTPAANLVTTGLSVASQEISDQSEPMSNNVNLIFNNGVASVPLSYANAGQFWNVDFKHDDAPYDNSVPELLGITLNASTASFVARPERISLSIINANSVCSSSTGSCSKFIAAGDPFTIKAEAECVGGAVADDYQGEVDFSHTLIAPMPGNSGTLNISAGTIAAVDGGSIDINNQMISEVGVFDLTAQDDDYFGEAIPVFTLGSVGRFYPAQFIMTSSSATNSCGSFSYMGQMDTEFDVRYTLEAHKAGGGLTQNYTGAFAKATPADHINIVAENNNDGGSYQSRLENLADNAWLNGQYVYSDSGYFARGIIVDGPYQLLQLGIQFTDNDGDLSELVGLDMKANSSADCDVVGDCDAWLIDDLDVRFGQLKLSNVFGPETFNLDMSMRTEYFDGTSFILNTDDSCTNLVVTDPPLSPRPLSWTGNLTVGETTPSLTSDITAGLGVIQFSAAGLGNEGSVIFEYDIGSWLKTENDGDADYADDPFGKVTFGQFRGTDRMIYWREVVR